MELLKQVVNRIKVEYGGVLNTEIERADLYFNSTKSIKIITTKRLIFDDDSELSLSDLSDEKLTYLIDSI